MEIKLICSDIDGTLLNAERELSNKTISAFQNLKAKLPIVLISSRMPSAMKHLQAEIGISDLPIIAYNGGLILVDGEEKQSTCIEFDLLKAISKLNTDNLHLSFYNKDDWFAPQMDTWTEREINNTKVNPEIKSNAEVLDLWSASKTGAHKIMCMGDADSVEKIYSKLQNEFGQFLHLYRSKPTYIEIAPKQISKLSAIQFLAKEKYNLTLDKIMGFGDNYNDIEMLKSIGLGLAVANAKPEVKQVAHQTIGYAKEDGVADFLNSHFNFK
ncbi:Cof-type HAD-IIB family hydrolase [Psychroflexus aestuariivivens]|uniref:Cof-type HAD-IIB family hydrolase n=1 Tax=Psychroflexus aestuariivivens TaxID=1795040 RepID=UPI000FDA3813|nr:Cof-type HAD-IIB family hydrolase [Psychroflexus aestuariivivens]